MSIRYDDGSVVFVPPLNWTVRAGENWAVVGGNGAGKTTLVDLISGENVLGYTQDIRLFGRRKGSGESVWSIRQHLGVISTATHMSYADFADPEVVALARANGFARGEGEVRARSAPHQPLSTIASLSLPVAPTLSTIRPPPCPLDYSLLLACPRE